MNNRRFFKESIVELESLFTKNKSNLEILSLLQEELTHRRTKKAKLLLRAIEETLARVDGNHTSTPNPKPRPEVNPLPPIPTVTLELTPPPTITDWRTSLAQSNDSISQPVDDAIRANHPSDILDTWTALEALSPQSFKNERDLIFGDGAVKPLTEGQEPWTLGEKSKPKHQLYFHAYLGAIRMEPATEALLKTFGDPRPDKSGSKGFASLAVLVVNREGAPLSEQSIAISSFGWAYGRVLNGQLDQLRHWDRAEALIRDALKEILILEDEDGKILPVNKAQIDAAHQWMVTSFGIPLDHAVPPHFAIKIFHRFGLPDPEPPLLNSFYIEDLQRAKRDIASKEAGKALRKYLGLNPAFSQIDLLKQHEATVNLLQPRGTPLGRWPTSGRHSLVLLQQLAVNLGKRELKDSGIVSVNGPPGTGKTTLLRDPVASIVVDRAKAMCAFDHPESAFTHQGSIRLGQSHVHLYEMDGSLRGHEILVASSNNKAVENISKELPLMESVDESLPPPKYFRTVSDNISGNAGETWGLIAAALGNSKNRFDFSNKAWWDPECGLMSYFKVVAGAANPAKDDEEKEAPKILIEEDPPSDPQAALQRWKRKKDEFLLACEEVEDAIAIAQDAHEKAQTLKPLQEKIEILGIRLSRISNELDRLSIEHDDARSKTGHASSRAKNSTLNEQSCLAMRPGFFSRLFKTKDWREWERTSKDILQTAIDDRKNLDDAEADLRQCAQRYTKKSQEHQAAEIELGGRQSMLNEAYRKITEAEPITANRLLDAAFWDLKHAEKQKHIPNFSDETQRLRDIVFKKSFELEKAFLDAAAKPVRHNIMALFATLSGNSLNGEKAKVLPSLWSTFFTLVPVVSTTFASVGRMIKNLPNGSIGWLLIDEAGQATPQAAVGAILRSRRAFVVGDPFQIEPVVSLPQTLIEKIATRLGVDAHEWCAPLVSAQSVADRSSSYGAVVPTSVGEMKIGSPLLVHRRCEEPMFSMSNDLAYDGQMVQATATKPSLIRNVLGPSAWYDIRSESRDKWSPEEGEEVINLLKKASSSLGYIPDFFVISPFRVVAQKMRALLRQEEAFFNLYGKVPDNWITNRVGTVHTFQGKEAESVILLLGAPSTDQDGARSWATNQVNLLNVAVSRAKRLLYVVGNRQAWGTKGNAEIINGRL